MEVGYAMAAPTYRPRFINLIRTIDSDPDTIVVPLTDELVLEGVRRFGQRLDTAWSLTDCIGFLVMEELRITDALTGDHHFAQAGFIPLLTRAEHS